MPREDKDGGSILGLVGKVAYGVFNNSVTDRAFLLKPFLARNGTNQVSVTKQLSWKRKAGCLPLQEKKRNQVRSSLCPQKTASSERKVQLLSRLTVVRA